MADVEKTAVLNIISLEPRCWHNKLKLLARPKRFELLTPKFVVWCSIQLSYGRLDRLGGGGAAEECGV